MLDNSRVVEVIKCVLLNTGYCASCASTLQEASVDASELWSQYEVLTAELAQSLYEKIHITFEPTLATQFK